MKVLLLNGSPHEKGCTYTALREAADMLEQCGVETESSGSGRSPSTAAPAAAGVPPERDVFSPAEGSTPFWRRWSGRTA